MSSSVSEIEFNFPSKDDAAAIHALVRICPPLEVNTGYAYLLLCTHFARTSIVARNHADILGFAGGYCPPEQPDTLFVWQIGVDPRTRGGGLGAAMLDKLILRLQPVGVRFLESTVSPSNTASQRMFRAFARRHGAVCEVHPHFESDLFGERDHEPEDLIRIGPLMP